MTLEEHAKEWEILADTERRVASIVGPSAAHSYREAMFRDTAAALRLEELTGLWHCVCHLSPNKEHRKIP